MIFIFFQKYKADIFRLETLLREKTKENKRLKDNFETLKQANDALKKEVLVFIENEGMGMSYSAINLITSQILNQYRYVGSH